MSDCDPFIVVPFDAMAFTRRMWKPFAVLLMAGLLLTSGLMLGLAEFHEEILEPDSVRMDGYIQSEVHDDTTPGLTRVMFGLSEIGSPQVLVPVIGVVAALLVETDAACGGGVVGRDLWSWCAGYRAEAAFPAGEAGPAVGFRA